MCKQVLYILPPLGDVQIIPPADRDAECAEKTVVVRCLYLLWLGERVLSAQFLYELLCLCDFELDTP